MIDVFAPGYERLERSVVNEASANASTSTLADLVVSPDGSKVYVHRGGVFPLRDLPSPIDVINIGSWTTNVFDSSAAFLGVSSDAQWLYVLDPPNPTPAGQTQDPVNAVGAALRVVDASGKQAAILLQDQIPLQFGHRANRVYVVRAGPDAPTPPFWLAQQGQDAFDLVVYEVGSWRELAKRSWHLPILLDVTPDGG